MTKTNEKPARRLFARTCTECGERFETIRCEADFCGVSCKNDFNNRRVARGVELYDLLMTCRFDRDLAAKEGLVMSTIMSNLAQHYRHADNDKRAGRKSWKSDSHKRLPITYDARSGDNR
jgi:hypothetical protein